MWPPPDSPKIRARPASAFKWSLLSEAATRLIGPLVFIALAKLLVPDDFGVVAAATIVVAFTQAISDFGLGRALVQYKGQLEEAADTAFWINLALALALAAILLVVAPAVATFFRDTRIAHVVRVLALLLPLGALATVPTALLHRELGFRELFWVRLVTVALPATAAIPLALTGAGYWALVASLLIGQALQAAVLWRAQAWRPCWRFDCKLALELAGFGKWAMLSALLAWFYGWMDALVIARFLGAHDLGLYRTAHALVTMGLGVLLAPLLPVLYTLFTWHRGDRGRVAADLRLVIRGIALVSLPAAALGALIATPAQELVFGPNWHGLSFAIIVLSAAHGIGWIVGANGEAYRAIGRPDLESWAMGLSLVAYLAAYLLAVRHGLHAFLFARLGTSVFGSLIQVAMARHALGIGWKVWLSACGRPLLFAGLVGAAYFLFEGPKATAAGHVALLVLGITAWLVYVRFFERDFIASLQNAFGASTKEA